MSAGIRATVEFPGPDLCPLFSAATDADTGIRDVAHSICSTASDASVTEFTIAETVEDSRFTSVFTHGETNRYRFDRSEPAGCPCECLGAFGLPVSQYTIGNGRLTIVFYAADYDELQEVIGVLREQFPNIDIKRLIQSPTDIHEPDLVSVDRGRLTDRQREVLQTAQTMGYFERPRGANATEIAEALGIDGSTFSEHLAAAQRKVLTDLFEGRT